jgi:DNA-binding MarR family transcriptional regulator
MGLIEVKPPPDDDQKVQIFLTAKGRLIADKVLDQIAKLDKPKGIVARKQIGAVAGKAATARLDLAKTNSPFVT